MENNIDPYAIIPKRPKPKTWIDDEKNPGSLYSDMAKTIRKATSPRDLYAECMGRRRHFIEIVFMKCTHGFFNSDQALTLAQICIKKLKELKADEAALEEIRYANKAVPGFPQYHLRALLLAIIGSRAVDGQKPGKLEKKISPLIERLGSSTVPSGEIDKIIGLPKPRHQESLRIPKPPKKPRAPRSRHYYRNIAAIATFVAISTGIVQFRVEIGEVIDDFTQDYEPRVQARKPTPAPQPKPPEFPSQTHYLRPILEWANEDEYPTVNKDETIRELTSENWEVTTFINPQGGLGLICQKGSLKVRIKSLKYSLEINGDNPEDSLLKGETIP